jgi:hypothetical protein
MKTITQNITGVELDTIVRLVNMRWNDQQGCEFEFHGWVFRVPSHNRRDVWATKKGTKGETKKTFCRLYLNN